MSHEERPLAHRPVPRGLLAVRRFEVPRDVIAYGHEFLREMGELGCEGLVLWAGAVDDHDATVVRVFDAIVPRQRALRGGNGVGLVVDGDELFRLNAACYARRLKLVGQVHSHPLEAYHSEVDDAFAVVTMAGGLSVVVPDFAAAPFDFATSALYRRTAEGVWTALDAAAAESLVAVIST